MKTHICMLWHCPYPWDIRISKFCRSLITAGYEVSIICRGKVGDARREEFSGVRIYRVCPPSWSPYPAMNAPLFFHPVWVAAVRSLLREMRPSVVMVRDIPMALLAGTLAKAMGIKVMLDMAENYPAALIAYNNALYKPFLFGNAWLPKQYERIVLRLMDHTLVVSEEQQRRLAGIGVEPDAVSVVMNTPDLAYFEQLPASGAVDQSKTGVSLLYVGNIDRHRGVDVLIRAVAMAVKTIPSLTLTLVGPGKEVSRLEALTRELQATTYVTFTHRVPFEQVPAYIQASDIGVIPHLKSEHTDTTIPNKLFDYMAFAKPVLSSDLNPVARIIRASDCGKVFESGNSRDLADKLVELVGDSRLAKFGLNGWEAVLNQYNWAKDQGVLLNAIRAVTGKS